MTERSRLHRGSRRQTPETNRTKKTGEETELLRAFSAETQFFIPAVPKIFSAPEAERREDDIE
jgi:hypothetical protein